MTAPNPILALFHALQDLTDHSPADVEQALREALEAVYEAQVIPDWWEVFEDLVKACTLSQPAYTDSRGVENLYSGHRTRQTCGIFVPVVPGVIAPACPINGREGRGIPNTRRRSVAVSNLPITPHRVSPQLRKSTGGHHGQ